MFRFLFVFFLGGGSCTVQLEDALVWEIFSVVSSRENLHILLLGPDRKPPPC